MSLKTAGGVMAFWNSIWPFSGARRQEETSRPDAAHVVAAPVPVQAQAPIEQTETIPPGTVLAEAITLVETRVPEMMAVAPLPGMVVGLTQGEDPTIVRSYGVLKAGQTEPMQRSTVFLIGSMTKPVVAVGMMKLVERGLITLDEPLLKRVKGWDLTPDRCGGFNPDGITLRRVLSHTSGMNVHSFPSVEAGDRIPTVPELLDGIDGENCRVRLIFEPGTASEYSGAAYTLLQLLMEQLTGEKFEMFMKREVLEPLGMKDSTFVYAETPKPLLATPHDLAGNSVPYKPLSSPSASGLYSTLDDVTRFWTAFVETDGAKRAVHGVLKPETVRDMLTCQTVGLEGPTWGLGALFYMDQDTVVTVRHGGQRPGWYCHAELDIRTRLLIVVMSNGEAGENVVLPLVREIRELATLHETRTDSPGASGVPSEA